MKTKIIGDAKRIIAFLDNRKITQLYTFGNGGSASIANHMACDLMKSTKGKYQVVSLSSNNALLSAIGNDLGYADTCREQIRLLGIVEKNAALILISSSGTSPNIANAAIYASNWKIPLIGFTGFTGGVLKQVSDLSVHINSDDFGRVEDYHSQVMHEVVRQIRAGFNGKA